MLAGHSVQHAAHVLFSSSVFIDDFEHVKSKTWIQNKERCFMKTVLLYEQANHGNQSTCSECYISIPPKHQKTARCSDVFTGYRNVKLELNGLNTDKSLHYHRNTCFIGYKVNASAITSKFEWTLDNIRIKKIISGDFSSTRC